jgi:ribosomal protein L11 methyltransferase
MLWRISFEAEPEAAPALAEAIESFCLAVGWQGSERDPLWRVDGLAADPLDRTAIHAATAAGAYALRTRTPEIRITPLPERNWVLDNLASFRPIQAGRFRLQGTHHAGQKPSRFALTLDAGLAFGTGEHASTRGCLLALDRLARAGRRFARVLDLGCGTAVLAMAAAAAWPSARVTASDIDPDAIATATLNVRRNRLAGRIRVVRADGFARRALARSQLTRPGGFDLVIANILARPLIRLARPLARALAPGGIAVLAGFVAEDAAWVAAPYRARRFHRAARFDAAGWTTLLLEKPIS